jgi:hypothetical protein
MRLRQPDSIKCGVRARFWQRSGWLGAVFAVAVFSEVASAAPADEIKALIEQNKPGLAYELGVAHPESLGDPRFDFYFGIAAIDAGHAGEGVLALERYVLQFPDNAAARAQLARGYFALGDDARARQEFEALLKTNPPEAVQATIDRYLNALRVREGNYKTTSSLFIEGGLGYDSNANSGAPNANVNVPVFGTVTLLPTGVKVSSWYSTVAAGGSITRPVAPGVALFGGASLDGKFNDNPNAHAYSLLGYGANGGVTYIKDNNLFRGTLAWNQLELDGARYATTSSLTGEWTRQLDELQTITPAVQYAELRYPTQPVRNSSLTNLGVTYRRAFAHAWQPILSVGGSYGEERNTKAINLARRISAVRVSAGASPVPKWVVSAGLSYQESQYRGDEPLLATTRHDRYGALDLLASYQWSRNLSIRAEVQVSTNHSNLGLFAYDRQLAAVKLRYDFK